MKRLLFGLLLALSLPGIALAGASGTYAPLPGGSSGGGGGGGGSGITQLTGDVVAGPGSGSQGSIIQAGVVSLADMANIATGSLVGRLTAGTGVPERLTGANAWSILGVQPAANFPALTGDCTTSAGSLSVACSGLALSKLAVQANQTFLCNVAGSSASPTACTAAQVKTALSLPNFSTDTILQLPNSTPANVNALELISSLTTNTAGSEVSRWLMKLLRGGLVENAYTFDPGTLTMDGAGTTKAINFNTSGSISAQVAGNSAGQLLLSSTSQAILFYVGATPQTTQGFQISQANGLLATGLRFNAAQGTALASASTLTYTASGSNGGNVFRVTGTTTINLFDANWWSPGAQVTLVFDGALTVKHGQTNSGTGDRFLLNGSVDFVTVAGSTLSVVLVSTPSGGNAWREIAWTSP